MTTDEISEMTAEIDDEMQSFLDAVSECFDGKSMAIVHCKDEQGEDVYVLASLMAQEETKDFRIFPIARLFKGAEIDTIAPVNDSSAMRAVQQSTLQMFKEQTGLELFNIKTNQSYN